MNCTDPHCPCRQPAVPNPGAQCSLNQALCLYIPPEGTHISCPVHGQHFLQGSHVTCVVNPLASNDLNLRTVC